MFDILGFGYVSVDDMIYVDTFPAPDAKAPVRRAERHCGGLTATGHVETRARLPELRPAAAATQARAWSSAVLKVANVGGPSASSAARVPAASAARPVMASA